VEPSQVAQLKRHVPWCDQQGHAFQDTYHEGGQPLKELFGYLVSKISNKLNSLLSKKLISLFAAKNDSNET